jgi:phosphoesterase RecJ-like protein
MVWRLSKLLGVDLPLDAAEAVFAGIVYDTGSFAYPKTQASTFECALELARKGVKPYTIHNRVYESSSVSVLILQKRVLGSLELLLDNRLAVQILTQGDLLLSGASYEDAEEFVNTPLMGKDVEVSLLVKEKAEGRWRCSLRSKGAVNVAHIAQGFGGGGHWTAAGFTSDLPLEGLKKAVLQTIEETLSKPPTRREGATRP